MECICCLSQRIKPDPPGLSGYYGCLECGLIFKDRERGEESRDTVISHYQYVDPHSQVSDSKRPFFNAVLGHLSSHVKKEKRAILDVGCGYGYFLEMAAARGWQCSGVELAPLAVQGAREKIGAHRIFHGPLREARYSGNSFDAITLWDVLAVIEEPFEELRDCFRILKRGGIIDIRTRNVYFQRLLYGLFALIRPVTGRFNIKEPYVFNRYCFSRKALSMLLQRAGFTNIHITNSPLTRGDPYGHITIKGPLRAIKGFAELISRFVFRITGGRLLIGPSLLLWAEKPSLEAEG